MAASPRWLRPSASNHGSSVVPWPRQPWPGPEHYRVGSEVQPVPAPASHPFPPSSAAGECSLLRQHLSLLTVSATAPTSRSRGTLPCRPSPSGDHSQSQQASSSCAGYCLPLPCSGPCICAAANRDSSPARAASGSSCLPAAERPSMAAAVGPGVLEPPSPQLLRSAGPSSSYTSSSKETKCCRPSSRQRGVSNVSEHKRAADLSTASSASPAQTAQNRCCRRDHRCFSAGPRIAVRLGALVSNPGPYQRCRSVPAETREFAVCFYD